MRCDWLLLAGDSNSRFLFQQIESVVFMIIFFMILAAVAAPALVWCAVLMVRWARHQPS